MATTEENVQEKGGGVSLTIEDGSFQFRHLSGGGWVAGSGGPGDVESLVVRSSLTAAKFGAAATDLFISECYYFRKPIRFHIFSTREATSSRSVGCTRETPKPTRRSRFVTSSIEMPIATPASA